MPVSALLLALAAAVVHATWNLLLSDARDVHSSSAVAVTTGVVAFAPVAALTWRLHGAAVPYIAASATLETVYLALLATGYSVAAMSFVYPIARGSAPVIVLLISVIALGVAVSALAAVGVVVVAVGIVLVRGVRGAGRKSDLLLALSVGACIAGYTLVDKHGITHANPIAYLELVFALVSIAYVSGVWRVRGGRAIRAAVNPRSLLAGLGYFGGYALTLGALALAPAASVAAVRESSVVMATAFLAVTGREQVGATRLLGALAVAGGIALVSLG
ncbi:MAG TPA: EamA family transporter [Solirubrobacteraceae bacterium]|nr:EamA family transporter [Solirubrobacteraceae bacterium]